MFFLLPLSGPGNSVGIATGYDLDGPGIESRWGRDFLHLSRPALGPTQPPVQWIPGFSPGVKSGRGVMLTPHSLLISWSWKGRAILLLPLWAVQPVQSLSACTRVHFTFILTTIQIKYIWIFCTQISVHVSYSQYTLTSASNRNEYQEHIFFGGGLRRPVPRADNLNHLHVPIELNLSSSSS